MEETLSLLVLKKFCRNEWGFLANILRSSLAEGKYLVLIWGTKMVSCNSQVDVILKYELISAHKVRTTLNSATQFQLLNGFWRGLCEFLQDRRIKYTKNASNYQRNSMFETVKEKKNRSKIYNGKWRKLVNSCNYRNYWRYVLFYPDLSCFPNEKTL